MPVFCPACAALIALGSLRCRACGVDARTVKPSFPMLGVLDVTGYNLDAYLAHRWPRFYRRNVIVERLHDLAPAFARWLATPLHRRGPRPSLEPEIEVQAEQLIAEYETLRDLY